MAKRTRIPSIKKLMSLKSVRNPRISPDGEWVAYGLQETDWEEDRFTSQIWMVHTRRRRRFQLTQGEKGAWDQQWSPNGAWLAFLSNRKGSKSGGPRSPGKPKTTKVADTQIWLISPSGGEALQLTQCETDVRGFRWSVKGDRIAFHAAAPESKALKERKESFGNYEVIDSDITMNELWVVSVPSGRSERVFKEADRSVESFAWSPDGSRLALELATDPRPKGLGSHDLYVLDLEDRSLKPMVVQPGHNGRPTWSPDGKQVAFLTALGHEDFFYRNTHIAVVSADGGKPTDVTAEFDESAYLIDWGPDGIYFNASQRTASHLYRLDPEAGTLARITSPDAWMGGSFSLTSDYAMAAFSSDDPESLSEIYVSALDPFEPRPLTSMTTQVKRYTFGTRELVSWTSVDGTEIEGVLYKPPRFNRRRKHPLLVLVHGGPAGVSRPTLDPLHGVYPVEHWLDKGAVVLNPNYRGSTGYGEAFRSLNIRNLGVGDMDDVLSGVDHLIAQGFVNPRRMGAMGWSQGGYISAFLTTHTDRFKAISVGAGISNWITYYVNTDIPPFTRQYLKATPWDDPEIYAKTSPMSAIRQAATPTLIQHCDGDRRVPIPNAYELRQGLEDQGVPVKMIVYKGFGHGISKPRALHAAIRHNLEWFDEWIWGDKPSR